MDDFDDRWEYSEDQLYRWWWSDAGPMVRRTRQASRGLGAVTVVDLFSRRATKPGDLKRAGRDHDMVGAHTDGVIIEVSGRSSTTFGRVGFPWLAPGPRTNRCQAAASADVSRRDRRRRASPSALCRRERRSTRTSRPASAHPNEPPGPPTVRVRDRRGAGARERPQTTAFMAQGGQSIAPAEDPRPRPARAPEVFSRASGPRGQRAGRCAGRGP